MKKQPLMILSCLLLLIACDKRKSMPDTEINIEEETRNSITSRNYSATGLDSPFISIDTANIMIKSYLKSIEPGNGDIKSLLVDAEALRYYLENEDIKYIKLMFAHRLSYARGASKDQNAGYKSNGLTVVIAGYDEDNNYIYTDEEQVLDFCRPCPYNCPENGSAARDTLY